MLKNIFKSAKNLLKSPVGQIGIGLLAPGFGFNPAVASGIAGLLGGDKPANIAKNLGITALLGGVTAGPGKTFSQGVMDTFKTPTNLIGKSMSDAKNVEDLMSVPGGFGGGGIGDLLSGAPGKILNFIIENPVKAAELGLLATAFAQGQDDPRMKDVDPTGISGIEGARKDYREELEKSKFQNASGGIAGYAMGGEKMTSIALNRETGEPSGMVTGPGTGKSDSIRFTSGGNKVPTDISNGEFIFTKKSVDEIGPKNLYALMRSVDKDAESFEEGQERMAMA
jgi:hypothetical protein|tara:strand:+ start:10 stop:855 length:846 start_codon:yes stop_codon:yes gene_type:complete